MRRIFPFVLLLAMPLALCSCLHVAPIQIKPIHIIQDVNIGVDKQLADFFAFEESSATRPSTEPATQPAAEPAAEPATEPATAPAVAPAT